MVQKTGHGQGFPYIRGFTGYRNLFLIDGFRLNNSVFRDGPNQYWNTVDPLGLHRMELVRGPFSMLYGSDAVGGTVNAIPRGGQDLEPGSRWDRRIYCRYASAENSSIARVESIGRLMPPTGRAGLRWDLNGRYWIEGSCTAVARADRLSTRDRADDSPHSAGRHAGLYRLRHPRRMELEWRSEIVSWR